MSEVSVLLPFRNAAATLCECFESILAQSFQPFEVLAIDDGSQDNSAAIARKFARQDPRIRLLQPGRLGLIRSLNFGIERARTPIIARMDADDRMASNRLQVQFDRLRDRPDLALVASLVELFGSQPILAGYREYIRWQNQCLDPDTIAANIYVESPFAHPSVAIRRRVLESVGGYRDGAFPEDYELWLRLHQRGDRMAKVPQTLLYWRDRGDRTSRTDPRYSRRAFDRLRADFLSRDPRVQAKRELVVWGAGKKTRRRVRLLRDRGISFNAWIDIDPSKIGRTLWDLPIHPPEWLDRTPRPFVLIYVTNHGARSLISSKLHHWGYRLGVDFVAVG